MDCAKPEWLSNGKWEEKNHTQRHDDVVVLEFQMNENDEAMRLSLVIPVVSSASSTPTRRRGTLNSDAWLLVVLCILIWFLFSPPARSPFNETFESLQMCGELRAHHKRNEQSNYIDFRTLWNERRNKQQHQPLTGWKWIRIRTHMRERV